MAAREGEYHRLHPVAAAELRHTRVTYIFTAASATPIAAVISAFESPLATWVTRASSRADHESAR